MVKGFSSCPGGSKKGMTQVCVTELFFWRRDKTRLEATSRIGGTGTRLMFSGPVAQENPVKIPEKFGMGRDCSLPLGKVLNVLEMYLSCALITISSNQT